MEQELQEGIEEQDAQGSEEFQEETQTSTPDDTQRLQEQQRARESGWVPKEEFRGDKTKWRPADEWNRRAETFLPIALATNKKLEDKIAALEAKLATSEGTLERIAKTQDKFSGDFYDTELTEIRTAKLRAVEAGDVDSYRLLEEREAKLVKPEPVQPTTPKGTDNQTKKVHPAVTEWRAGNPWFDPDSVNPKGDDVMTAYALRVGQQLAEKNDPVSFPGQEEAFCKKVGEIVKGKFPDKFSNPNRQRQNIDETGLRGGEEFAGDNSKKDWNHLPPAAKAACMKQIAANPKINKETWVKYYYEQEEA